MIRIKSFTHSRTPSGAATTILYRDKGADMSACVSVWLFDKFACKNFIQLLRKAST